MNEKDLLEIHLSEEDATEVSLNEIDPKAINLIRELKRKNNSDYRQLKNAIERDGQRQPIIVRELNDEEKVNLPNPKKIRYGIIDGHHRYMIAEELKKDTILAVIDREKHSSARDIVLAMRFNESSIRMTSIQKGKVIYDLLNIIGDKTNAELIEKIGKKLFGLKSSMTYRCLHNYKKSIHADTIEKPRENKYDWAEVRDVCGNLPKDLSNLADTSSDDGLKQLENIKKVEQHLGYLKKAISSLEQVKLAMKAKRQENIKLAREKKKAMA